MTKVIQTSWSAVGSHGRCRPAGGRLGDTAARGLFCFKAPLLFRFYSIRSSWYRSSQQNRSAVAAGLRPARLPSVNRFHQPEDAQRSSVAATDFPSSRRLVAAGLRPARRTSLNRFKQPEEAQRSSVAATDFPSSRRLVAAGLRPARRSFVRERKQGAKYVVLRLFINRRGRRFDVRLAIGLRPARVEHPRQSQPRRGD